MAFLPTGVPESPSLHTIQGAIVSKITVSARCKSQTAVCQLSGVAMCQRLRLASCTVALVQIRITFGALEKFATRFRIARLLFFKSCSAGCSKLNLGYVSPCIV